MAPVSRAVRIAACSMLLASPAVLAFFSGGYFQEARAWAGVGAWVLVATALLTRRLSIPPGRASWLAFGGLALLAGWTLLSTTWAPIAGSAYYAGQLAFVYLGGLLAATAWLRSPAALRAVEPALAAGALIVVGYGMSERLLPGLLHFTHSASAQGRLEQPLTYWNGMGELAALGFVLCVRLSGNVDRAAAIRMAAAAGTVPLALGLYVSFSRGALFACLAGLLALLVLAPRREQLRALAVCILTGAAVAAAVSPLHGVTSLSGSLATRERQGAIALAILVAGALIAAGATWWLSSRARTGPLTLPKRAPLIALGLICAGLAVAIVLGAKEGSQRPLSGGASRLATLQSDRYAYWDVAFRAFAADPVQGAGAGGWAVDWLRWRHIDSFAQDAHSLEIQTLAELGIVGFALLLAFLGGIALACARVHRRNPALAAGPIAACVVWLAHSPLDWDWQLPAVTLVALIAAGAVLAMLAQEPRAALDRQRGIVLRKPGSAEEPVLDREARV